MHHLLFLSFYFSFRKKVSSNEDLRNENFAGVDRSKDGSNSIVIGIGIGEQKIHRIRLKEVRCLPRFYVTNRRA